MRRAALLFLVACGSTNERAVERPIVMAPDAAAPSPVAQAAASADAGARSGADEAPVADEAPLAWGARPSKDGPLWAVVDGMCIHGEVWPLENTALLTYGNPTDGGYSRGDRTTFARFTDDGLETDQTALIRTVDPKLHFGFAPANFIGRWPSPLVAYTGFESGNRLGEPSAEVWTHEDAGWKRLASAEEKRGEHSRFYLGPIVFQDHVIIPEYVRYWGPDMTGDKDQIVFRAVPPLAGVERLNFNGSSSHVSSAATADALYVATPRGIRELSNGKTREVIASKSEPTFLLAGPAILASVDGALFELIDGKLSPFTPPLAPKAGIGSPSVAPNGDLWMTSGDIVIVARKGEDGRHTRFDKLPIPAPAVPRPEDDSKHDAANGGRLAGVEHDDPWVIGKLGTLHHFRNGAFEEVTLPKPPWSSNRYRAQRVAMKQKGDLFVNAGYGEKGLGWTTPERYRAILRTKRPRETLRCNEPAMKSGYESGEGFMSYPPLADDTCKTPFVEILRTAFATNKPSERSLIFDKNAEFPSVREAIKATPALGETVTLVEHASGNQRYLGVAVPSLALGRDLVTAVAKRVKVFPELRPEIVCGTPEHVERTIKVEVATGKIVP